MNQNWDLFFKTGTVADYLAYRKASEKDQFTGCFGEEKRGKVNGNGHGYGGIADRGI